jgi:hypothetical protein
MFESGDEPKILTESEVMELKKKHGIVLFYMNGCGHCETMKPAWNKVITELKDRHKNEIILGAIESSDMDIFKKHGISPSVSGFPTILYFHPNKLTNPEPYNGDRSYEDLKKWILSKKGKGNKPVVILANYNPNNKLSQSGGGRIRRRRNTRRKSHTRRKTSMRKNTRRRYRH